MAAKPKRVQSKRGRQQTMKQSRGPGRRRAKPEQEEARAAPETNGHEEPDLSEPMEQPFMAASEFARATREQIKRATGQSGWSGVRPQVLGWSGTGPAQQVENMVKQFWNLGGTDGSNPYMRALAQANVEMVGLIGRRSRAYLDLPTHLAQCRTPQQILEEQAKFFQEMLHDYQVTNDRMVNCWIEATAPSEQR